MRQRKSHIVKAWLHCPSISLSYSLWLSHGMLLLSLSLSLSLSHSRSLLSWNYRFPRDYGREREILVLYGPSVRCTLYTKFAGKAYSIRVGYNTHTLTMLYYTSPCFILFLCSTHIHLDSLFQVRLIIIIITTYYNKKSEAKFIRSPSTYSLCSIKLNSIQLIWTIVSLFILYRIIWVSNLSLYDSKRQKKHNKSLYLR
jgi:hypothetical protein